MGLKYLSFCWRRYFLQLHLYMDKIKKIVEGPCMIKYGPRANSQFFQSDGLGFKVTSQDNRFWKVLPNILKVQENFRLGEVLLEAIFLQIEETVHLWPYLLCIGRISIKMIFRWCEGLVSIRTESCRRSRVALGWSRSCKVDISAGVYQKDPAKFLSLKIPRLWDTSRLTPNE